jgi:hypothetical protein
MYNYKCIIKNLFNSTLVINMNLWPGKPFSVSEWPWQEQVTFNETMRDNNVCFVLDQHA